MSGKRSVSSSPRAMECVVSPPFRAGLLRRSAGRSRGTRSGDRYSASLAQEHTWARARRPRPRKLGGLELREQLTTMLTQPVQPGTGRWPTQGGASGESGDGARHQERPGGRNPSDLRKPCARGGTRTGLRPCTSATPPKTFPVRPGPTPVQPTPKPRVCTLCTPFFASLLHRL